ncbi:MAG TPA: hypothetical protein VIE14_07360 [Steroidobacteraceae bacterium]|jgi:hypothetical protein
MTADEHNACIALLALAGQLHHRNLPRAELTHAESAAIYMRAGLGRKRAGLSPRAFSHLNVRDLSAFAKGAGLTRAEARMAQAVTATRLLAVRLPRLSALVARHHARKRLS